MGGCRKRIGIVTLFGYFNYGNRLQNYALHRFLTDRGFDVETIVSQVKQPKLNMIVKIIAKKDNGGIRLRSKGEIKMEKNFKGFTCRFIPTRFIRVEQGGIPMNVDDEYDYFIVGSDQVWNSMFWGRGADCKEENDYLLRFASAPKRISYAASFGISEIPETRKLSFERELRAFRAISVRERTGSQIAESLLERPVPVVVDPTMLIDASIWRGVASASPVACDYALSFFIGEKSGEAKRCIEELRAQGLVVVDLLNERDCLFGAGPDTFLSLVDEAKCVVTDSFHATVFSILFATPFVVFSRKHANGANMDDRIRTLLSTFGFEERYNRIPSDLLAMDFSSSDRDLKAARDRSLGFLDEALEC